MGRFLVFITFAYVMGIVLGRYFFSLSAGIYLFIGALIWVVFNLARKNESPVAVIPLLLIFLAAGSLSCNLFLQKMVGNIREFAGEKCTLTGMVDDEPLWRDGEIVLLLRPERIIVGKEECLVSGMVRVTLRMDAAKKTASRTGQEENSKENAVFSYGREISLQGVLYHPEVRRNPGGFDYRSFLETRGVAAVFYGSVSDAADLGVSDRLSWIRQAALQTRQRMSSVLEAFLPRREAGLLTGMLFGERNNLDPATEQYFQRSGVSHLLAVSGLHTGLVAAFLFFILKRTGLGNRKWPLFLLTAVFLFAYVLLTGLKPATLRAFIMILTGLLAFCLGRDKDLPSALAAAGLMTLLYNPLLLFNAGFQFSYAATAAIIVVAPSWQKGLSDFLNAPFFSSFPWRRQFSSLAAVTLAAQFGVLPLCAYYFAEVSLVAFVANMLLLPVMALVLGIGLFAALVGMLFPSAGSFFVLAAYPLLAYMTWLTEFLGGAAFAAVELFSPRIWEALLYYALLFSPLVTGASFSRELLSVSVFKRPLPLPQKCVPVLRMTALLLLPVLVFIWWGGTFYYFPGKLEVVFLDVGQGDAIYIRTPRGKHLLLDAGGRQPYEAELFDPGSRVVVPFLQHKRVRELDAVLISHPHEDHFGGFAAVLEKFSVGLLLTSPEKADLEQYNNLLETARRNKIPRKMLQAGDRITLGPSLEIKIFNPPEKLFFGTGSDPNNNSLVAQLCYKKVCFLLTGDIETRAVDNLLNNVGLNLQSQILKIPHHGGYLAEMPAFLNSVNPSVAVISVGRNSFGHPHSESLLALKDKNVDTYRTDLHGAVIIRSNGYVWTVKTLVKEAPSSSLSLSIPENQLQVKSY